MPTKAGKIQVQDIKQGKVFYMVHADFPIVDKALVGDGEVSAILAIRPTGRPYRKGRAWKFDYLNAWGGIGTVDLQKMQKMHNQTLLDTNKLYTPIFATRSAAQRFAKAFELRTPTKREREQARHRQSLKIYG